MTPPPAIAHFSATMDLNSTIFFAAIKPMSKPLYTKNWIALLLALTISFSGRAANLPPEKYTEWSTEREIFVPMRDGVNLSTTVVRPVGAAAKLPTVLVRTPYDDTSKLFGHWLWL